MEKFNRFLLAFALALPLGSLWAAPLLSLDDCRRQALAGEAEAQWQMGLRYESGDGVKKDIMRAVGQFRKAADQGHREACSKMAGYYESGSVVGKNAAQAAKYRAMAKGEDVELAISDAKAEEIAKKYDEVEVALDYIIGRNGRERDPKTGIRLLYNSAKDNPDAQRVFCEAWAMDAIDIGEIDATEWQLIVPWFRNAFKNGLRPCGLVLGNDAYDHGKYQAAISYWTAAGNAGVGKAWYQLGLFHDPVQTKEFPAPKAFQSERRAKAAYEKSSKITWNGDEDALFMLGQICLFGEDKECLDYERAFEIFAKFLQQEPDNKVYLRDYGWAGIWSSSRSKIALLEEMNRQLRAQSFAPAVRRDMEARREQLRHNISQAVNNYLRYIKKSADLGYEPAQRDLIFLNSILGN